MADARTRHAVRGGSGNHPTGGLEHNAHMASPDVPVTTRDLTEDPGDPDEMVGSLRGLSEPQRLVLWEQHRNELCRILSSEERTSRSDDEWALFRCARAAAILCLGPVDVVRLVGSWLLSETPPELIQRAVTTRSPNWRAGFTDATLRDLAREREISLFGPEWWDWWRAVRRLEQDGVLSTVGQEPDYLVLLVRGLMFGGDIVAAVRADPELVDRSIWALFKPEPPVQKALVGSERYWDPSNTWSVSVVRLAQEGLIDGPRLVAEASAASIDEHIAAGHRRWYKRVGELLADSSKIPSRPQGGPPPLGNRLQR